MTTTNIFLDSDVVVSSVLSKTGSAFFVLTSSKLSLFVSNYSKNELRKVAKRTNLDFKAITDMLSKNKKIFVLKKPLKTLKKEYRKFVRDEDDAHIVAGAVAVKAEFLLTYNLRDFRIDKIKSDFGILVLTPGNFLQYLRSVDKF